MNRAERLLEVFIRFRRRATLGELIEATKEYGGLGYKLTAAISELRALLEAQTPPKTICWERGGSPHTGIYSIVALPVDKPRIISESKSMEQPQLPFDPIPTVEF